MAKRTPQAAAEERPALAPAATKTKKQRLQVSVEDETCRALRAHCGYLGIDAGEAVTAAIKDWLKTQPPLRLGGT